MFRGSLLRNGDYLVRSNAWAVAFRWQALAVYALLCGHQFVVEAQFYLLFGGFEAAGGLEHHQLWSIIKERCRNLVRAVGCQEHVNPLVPTVTEHLNHVARWVIGRNVVFEVIEEQTTVGKPQLVMYDAIEQNLVPLVEHYLGITIYGAENLAHVDQQLLAQFAVLLVVQQFPIQRTKPSHLLQNGIYGYFLHVAPRFGAVAPVGRND